ncbi:MAG: thioredoxin domain-containing protein [Thiolinea sp.]
MRTFLILPHLSLLLLSVFCLLFPKSGYTTNTALANHPSPYLRSHADDTVQWRLFNKDAFQQALRKQKPILISSGYQSCYWCYRMKEDNFNNPEQGAFVNQHFIPVLVDRELEPETDQWLQQFMEQQRGFGGWPLSVIMTPDAKPIAGYSYTPAKEFTATLKRFIRDWNQNPEAILDNAKQNYQALQNRQQRNSSSAQTNIPAGVLLQHLLRQLSNSADHKFGGFGEREKFPFAPQLNALFELQQLNPDPALQEFMQTTLAAMIGGNLRDHLGGGFFRYSDDRDWTQPHYEKMLYTQALLAPLLIRAGTAWKQPVYTQVGIETLLSMVKRFQRDDGYFLSSLSAVSADGKSGGYYLWTPKQLKSTLRENQHNKVLNLLGEDATLILPFVLAQGEEKQHIQHALLTIRAKRPQSVDNKALTSWNGLALSALASGSAFDAGIQQAGQKLASRLLQLSQQENIAKLADQPQSQDNTASFTAKVYLARGLADWGVKHQQPEFLKAAQKLLLHTYKHHYRKDGWIYSEDNPLLGTLARHHLPDSQLPSASALWLQTARMLVSTDARNQPTELVNAIAAINTLPNDEMTEQAFFHASYIAEQVKHQIITTRKQQEAGLQ